MSVTAHLVLSARIHGETVLHLNCMTVSFFFNLWVKCCELEHRQKMNNNCVQYNLPI